MPKPILSDSLFNADDVATAILQQANLQIANESLVVVNLSSFWSYNSPFQNGASAAPRIYAFMGFVFFSDYIYRNPGPSGDITVGSLSNSNYHPIEDTFMPGAGYQGDTAEQFRWRTDGTLTISNPHNPGSNVYYALLNGFYRYTAV